MFYFIWYSTNCRKERFFWVEISCCLWGQDRWSVSTHISKVLDPHKASRYQGRFCSFHFKSQNCGNYSLVSRIPLGYPSYEIVGGERIEVCFEIAPSARIVVKMYQVQLFHSTPNTGGFSVDKMHGHKIGFDLVGTSSRFANKDEDLKRSCIWEDEDLMINNKRDTEYIHLFEDKHLDNFIIERHNTAQILEDVDGPYRQRRYWDFWGLERIFKLCALKYLYIYTCSCVNIHSACFFLNYKLEIK